MDNSEPNDPMWATFRERHPDVNLVLLPGDGAVEEPPPAPSVSLDQAREASAALERKVRLIGELLGVPHDPEASRQAPPLMETREPDPS